MSKNCASYTPQGGRFVPFSQTLTYCMYANQWPTQLRKYVLSRGADVVENAGLDVLGYPATWAATPREFLELLTALESTKEVRK